MKQSKTKPPPQLEQRGKGSAAGSGQSLAASKSGPCHFPRSSLNPAPPNLICRDPEPDSYLTCISAHAAPAAHGSVAAMGQSKPAHIKRKSWLHSTTFKKACTMLCGKGRVRTQDIGYRAERYDHCTTRPVNPPCQEGGMSCWVLFSGPARTRHFRSLH